MEYLFKSLAILAILVFTIVRAYENYWRRIEMYYTVMWRDSTHLGEPNAAKQKADHARKKWHKFQAIQHILICSALPIIGIHWSIIPLGLMIIWTLFDFLYSYLTITEGVDNRNLWEFGSTAFLDKLQSTIFFGNGKVAFGVKLSLSLVGIVLFYIFT